VPHLSLFDLDQTLFAVNSSSRFGIYLYLKQVFKHRDFLFIISCHLRARMGLLSLQALHDEAFKRLFFGRSLESIKSLVQLFIDRHFEEMIYRPAYEELQQAKEKGHFTAILSSSPDFLVSKIAARFGVNEWMATKYDVDSNQKFNRISHLVQGEDKSQYVRHLLVKFGLDKRDVTAYSDSHLDLPFLQAAGHAVGVNPNRKLLAICKRNHWRTI
jgi:HAD superfamily hydrolase (TIGR01490 family)